MSESCLILNSQRRRPVSALDSSKNRLQWLMRAVTQRGRVVELRERPRFHGEQAADQLCPLYRSLDVLGHRWLLLIVRELLIAPRRFTELQRALPGVSSNILKDRLERLDDMGMLQIHVSEGVRRYRLRGAALSLAPVLGEVAAWGAGWMDRAPAGANFSPAWMRWWFSFWLEEPEIDRRLSLEVSVEEVVFGVELQPGNVKVRPGPVPAADARLQIRTEEVLSRGPGPLLTPAHVGGDADLAAALRRIFPFLDDALAPTAPDRRQEVRSYGQLCPLAVALDLVGESWTLVIIRDLAIRAHGFSELIAGNPGLHRQLLSKRLAGLIREGLITREGEGRRAKYGLTRNGATLTRVFMALGFWGVWEMPPARGGAWFRNAQWAFNWMRAHFSPEAAAGHSIRCQLYIDDEPLWICIADGTLRTGIGELDDPDCTIRGPVSVWMDSAWSEVYGLMAMARGWGSWEGPPSLLMLIYSIFRFPSWAPASDPRVYRASTLRGPEQGAIEIISNADTLQP